MSYERCLDHDVLREAHPKASSDEEQLLPGVQTFCSTKPLESQLTGMVSNKAARACWNPGSSHNYATFSAGSLNPLRRNTVGCTAAEMLMLIFCSNGTKKNPVEFRPV